MKHNGGFGVGLHSQHLVEAAASGREVDWLEVIAENWIDRGGLGMRHLDRCAERWPIALHGVSMSIGGRAPLDEELFQGARRLARRLRSPHWSDHVCFATDGGSHLLDLLPLPFNDEALDHLVERMTEAQSMSDVPLIFENPTYYVRMPESSMSEAAFLTQLTERTGCGLLLDVNNVYVNSVNHGYDPEAFLDRIPMGSVREIHIAGHSRELDLVIDDHSGPVPAPVWHLYRYALTVAGRQIPTLLEWDTATPSFDELVDELDRARDEARLALGTSA